MADDFGLEIAGDRFVALRFDRFPEAARRQLKNALGQVEQRLAAAVQAAEPQRTGALRAETLGRVVEKGDRISAVVGVRASSAADAGKAAALEYGATRAFQVRAHQAMLTHLWGRFIAPLAVEVGAHMRTPAISPRRYLRGPVEAMREAALAAMKAAVEEAVSQ